MCGQSPLELEAAALARIQREAGQAASAARPRVPTVPDAGWDDFGVLDFADAMTTSAEAAPGPEDGNADPD